jgi:hypothetical protein
LYSSQLSLAAKQGLERLNNRYDNQERGAILEWLTPIDYSAQQREIASRREEETGIWLL